jgi:hypothetical protein
VVTRSFGDCRCFPHGDRADGTHEEGHGIFVNVKAVGTFVESEAVVGLPRGVNVA